MANPNPHKEGPPTKHFRKIRHTIVAKIHDLAAIAGDQQLNYHESQCLLYCYAHARSYNCAHAGYLIDHPNRGSQISHALRAIEKIDPRLKSNGQQLDFDLRQKIIVAVGLYDHQMREAEGDGVFSFRAPLRTAHLGLSALFGLAN